MREKIIYALGGLGGLLLVYNLNVILLQLQDDAQQGAIYRIMFFHIPAAMIAWAMFTAALVSSAAFLITKNFKFDSLAVAATEIGVVFLTVNLVTGSIWARIIWGIWWTWDARLTSNFISWLLYIGYLILRPAIQEPTQRATLAAVLSIFAFADLPIVYYSNQWWRTQHPAPVLTTGGLYGPWWPPLLTNLLVFLLIGTALLLIRLRQENVQREMDSMRRYAHAI
ncbi:MAG: cytochrome c biogenesis protein [Acidobacteriota bacterium]|nr:cytochrome c biogenesis protein [Acidobacteriota bacterium]